MDGDIRMLFAPGERAELAAARGTRKVDLFYSLWTMKEALVKAVGTGLSLDTASFEIPPSMYRGARRCVIRLPETSSLRWRLENLGNLRFAAALAHEIPPPPEPDVEEDEGPDAPRAES